MGAATDLLTAYLGLELTSIVSYVLAGYTHDSRRSAEAALKYVVYGGGASGIMLYGISLLAGKFGTGYLPEMAKQYVLAVQPGAGIDLVVVLGTLFLLIGLAFKLSAVPFHFWCPDVFEGASAEVAGFLSVASKGAALALLGRVVFILGGLDEAARTRADWLAVAQYLLPTLAILAAVTATFGNFAAYMQTNLKRLLAYSTIAHAGYMIMGLAPLTSDGAGAVLFYLVTYLFTNLGAFAVVAFLRNQTGSEELSSFRGLIHRSPVLVITLAVFMLSLLGVPPLAGFAAKFQIFCVLYNGGQYYDQSGYPALGYALYALFVIGGLNTVLSLFYYVKVLKVMILETTLEEVEGRPAEPLPISQGPIVYSALLAMVIFVLGILWGPLESASARGVDRFEKGPAARPGEVAQKAPEVRP
jgi:NADH-quinone oxidoreductase subunit N